MRPWAIVPAAGSGSRLGLGFNKVLAPVAGRPLLHWTLANLASWPRWQGLVLVHASDERAHFEAVLEGVLASLPLTMPVVWALGGSTREASVRSGLAAASDRGADWVAVHDAARPLIAHDLLDRLAERAERVGAAIPGIPVADTLKRVTVEADSVLVRETVPREGLWAVQTPQFARADWLRDASTRAAAADVVATDEAGLLERAGYPVAVVPGDPKNLKVTRPGDLERVEAWLGTMSRA